MRILEYTIVRSEYHSIPWCFIRPCETGRTGAQQLRAEGAGADRVIAKVDPSLGESSSRALVKVAAAWVGRILLTADVGLAGSRGRNRARRRGDDREIACRAPIAPIHAPRIAGCTRRRRGSAAIIASHPNARDADVVSEREAFTWYTFRGMATAVRTHGKPRHVYCAVPSGLNEGAAVGMRLGARVAGKRVGALVVGKRVGAWVVGMAATAFGFKETPHVRASVSKCVFDVAVHTNKGHPPPSAVDNARKKCYTPSVPDEYPSGRWSTQSTPCMPSQQLSSPGREAVSVQPVSTPVSWSTAAARLEYPVVPRSSL